MQLLELGLRSLKGFRFRMVCFHRILKLKLMPRLPLVTFLIILKRLIWIIPRVELGMILNIENELVGDIFNRDKIESFKKKTLYSLTIFFPKLFLTRYFLRMEEPNSPLPEAISQQIVGGVPTSPNLVPRSVLSPETDPRLSLSSSTISLRGRQTKTVGIKQKNNLAEQAQKQLTQRLYVPNLKHVAPLQFNLKNKGVGSRLMPIMSKDVISTRFLYIYWISFS